MLKTGVKKGFVLVGLSVFLFSGMLYAAPYEIDTTHSNVGFAVKHLMVSTVQGNFTDYTGTIEFDKDNLSGFKADVTIQAKSINTQLEARDNHLRTSDFFDIENHPMIIFKSTKIVSQGDGYEITGDLTIRGVTKEITIPLTIEGPVQSPFGAEVIGLSGEAQINRQDFGVSWNKQMDSGGLIVSDNVKIVINIEAGKK